MNREIVKKSKFAHESYERLSNLMENENFLYFYDNFFDHPDDFNTFLLFSNLYRAIKINFPELNGESCTKMLDEMIKNKEMRKNMVDYHTKHENIGNNAWGKQISSCKTLKN